MITIIKDKNPNHIFAALKLCEQLYNDGKIPLYMFRNMVNQNADVVDASKFNFTIQQEGEKAG